ncbi:hypothetical protein A2960_01875 [Candidatus Gottesmanbacteria bacterium RIFCSPLOWO2_01_FULL_39_12b]|uniref:Uncharacterized protein n=1 Tax=Candidatus Gottesmanbacteria bacterium RIFCSPLOWO2_01_FULL_39_12b TaxID=1798388 RepID=A0A1F6ARH9_9BACT|nr:MAG: hypothetical protein A2960_01875 [Candidatus Gottesmanbacteria bacterium RIFCSPLOWO2_01_FULL_39_12b]
MKILLKKYFITILSVFTLTQIISSFVIKGGWNSLFYASLILSILFWFAKPLINIIMLPVNLLTLNLAAWFVNIIIFLLWIRLVPDISINSWQFSGANLKIILLTPFYFSAFQVIILCSILLTIIIQFFKWLIR